MDAIEPETSRPTIEPDTLRSLMQRRDGPGVQLFVVQLSVLLAGLGAAAWLGARHDALAWLAACVAAVGLVGFFPAMHEAGHGTAFANPRLNQVVLRVGAFVMLQAPTFFQEFHWQHHRHTQDRTLDPEIAGAPAVLDGWPTNPVTYLLLASGQLLMVGKAMFTVGCAVLPTRASAWDSAFPFVRASKRSRIAWESRATLLAWAAVLLAGFQSVDGFAYALLAWPLAHVLLGIYLMAEHTGLPNDGSQLHRTRTIHTFGVVQWWMWNMPLHAVHHAYPAIPFHAVPEANTKIAASLEHVAPGLWWVHRTALAHALHLRREDAV